MQEHTGAGAEAQQPPPPQGASQREGPANDAGAQPDMGSEWSVSDVDEEEDGRPSRPIHTLLGVDPPTDARASRPKRSDARLEAERIDRQQSVVEP